MPSPCFISHAYADQEIVKGLVQRLPKGVSPFVFPPITVTPDQRVSDDLVAAILKCRGLIYVEAAHSSQSVWVSFERDYALRAGKAVFSYTHKTSRFARETSAPLDLPVFPAYSGRDRVRVDQVTSFMRDKRQFDVWMDKDIEPGTNWQKEIEGGREDRLSRGGYMVAFISHNSTKSESISRELVDAAERWPNQILPVLLDPVASTAWPVALQQRQAVVLHQRAGHEESLNWNGIDDLIVRIYDLVYRHSRKRGVMP
jgi:hypothetical protein